MVSCLLCASTLCLCYLVILHRCMFRRHNQLGSFRRCSLVFRSACEFVVVSNQEETLPDQDRHGLFDCLRYSADFGQDRDILRWLLNYLDPTKAGLLTHLLKDGGPINISYMNYDWSLNV